MDVSIDYQCDEYLMGYFDEELIRNVINSSIGNALRHCKDTILLSANNEAGYLVIRVEDDGAGFPEVMLNQQKANEADANLNSGRTQLGLVFAEKTVRSHTQGDKVGRINMTNKYNLNGGCFEVFLP